MIPFVSLASHGFLIQTALSLNVATHSPLPKLSAKLPPDSLESHSPNNQHAASLNTSLTPAKPPPLAHNVSALIELGLDVNSSISWSTSASGNAIGVQCNEVYGRELDLEDCVDAWAYISSSDTTQHTYAKRNTGHIFDLPLPHRFSGCSSFSYSYSIRIPTSFASN